LTHEIGSTILKIKYIIEKEYSLFAENSHAS